jgi:hypothetical protein
MQVYFARQWAKYGDISKLRLSFFEKSSDCPTLLQSFSIKLPFLYKKPGS